MLLPGAILDPGAHWSYQAGYTSCLVDVGHYTVGHDSRALIRDRGLCSVLVRDEGIYEYAPMDALTYTQCEWNPIASGTEVESIDGTLTPAKLDGFAYVTVWKQATLGIPPNIYADGPRLPIGSGFRGHTNHRQLEHRACDQHSDGYPPEIWAALLAGGNPTPAEDPRGDDAMLYFGRLPSNPNVALGLLVESGVITCLLEGPPDAFGFPPGAGIWIDGGPNVGAGKVPWRYAQPYVLGWLLRQHDDIVNRRYVGGTTTVSGAIDPETIRNVVRGELDRTRLAPQAG